MGINIVYTSDDNKFKPFSLHLEPYITDNSNFDRSTLKLVNKDLGLEIFLESGDNEITINQKIRDDLDLSYKKIVDDFDDNKQIFRSLKKIKVNLEQLINSS
jgi:hypothetical protein